MDKQFISYKTLLDRETTLGNSFYRAICSKKVCFFLGAGIGQNIKLPRWNDLAHKIVNFFCCEKKVFGSSNQSYYEKLKSIINKENNPLKAISVCIDAMEKCNDSDLIDSFNNELKMTIYNENSLKEVQNHPVYQNLAELANSKKALFVQTNYDDYLQFKQDQLSGKKNILESYVPYAEDAPLVLDNKIVYIHGILKRNMSDYRKIILSQRDYNQVYQPLKDEEANKKHSRHKEFLKKIFDGYFVIFLGYSLGDIEVVQQIAAADKVIPAKENILIVDNYKAKEFDNTIDARALWIASEEKVSTCYYDTEQNGFAEFKTIVADLKNYIEANFRENISPDANEYEGWGDYEKP